MYIMRVAYCSDAHFDIWFHITRDIPHIINDCEADVLVLAGDIFEYNRWNVHFHDKILKLLCDRFKHVVLIDGNHEYYGLEFECDRSYNLLKDAPSNLKYLRNESVEINGVVFYGGTFWTNPMKWSPLEQFDVTQQINDFHYIKEMDFHSMEIFHNDFIEGLMETSVLNSTKDIVVVSHFPPTELSIHPRYQGHLTNAYFVNRYFNEFYNNNQIKHWICGHVHHKHEFEIGNIKGHCNPIGYPREGNDFILDYFDMI